MCLPFLKEKAEDFSDNIIYNMPDGVLVLNEELEVQQINRAARGILNIKHKSDILNAPVIRILNPSIYLEVMNTGKNVHNKLTYLTDNQRYVEETVINDKTYHIIFSNHARHYRRGKGKAEEGTGQPPDDGNHG
jgi:sensor histidine kinase regulating citrate/malate metabolism